MGLFGEAVREAMMARKNQFTVEAEKAHASLEALGAAGAGMTIERALVAERMTEIACKMGWRSQPVRADSFFSAEPLDDIPAVRAQPFEDVAYLVWAVGTDRYKIGHAKDAKARVSEVQTGCPYEARLVAVYRGGAEMEGHLHRRFAAYRVIGEWFALPSSAVRFLLATSEHEPTQRAKAA